MVYANVIQLNNFKGLTGTTAVNEFVPKVIELVKNMSSSRKEQKGKIKPRKKLSSLNACSLATAWFTKQKVQNTFLVSLKL